MTFLFQVIDVDIFYFTLVGYLNYDDIAAMSCCSKSLNNEFQAYTLQDKRVLTQFVSIQRLCRMIPRTVIDRAVARECCFCSDRFSNGLINSNLKTFAHRRCIMSNSVRIIANHHLKEMQIPYERSIVISGNNYLEKIIVLKKDYENFLL